jgi:hypothetical protein
MKFSFRDPIAVSIPKLFGVLMWRENIRYSLGS